MDTRNYIFKSLWHYRFSYLGVFLGSVLGAMVLLGALFAGSSVKESLRRISEYRTGQATHLISGGDRFFREQLAEDLHEADGLQVAPVLFAKGVASGNSAVANQVQLVGITESFWEFAPEPAEIKLDQKQSQVAVNRTLADRLNLKAGDTLIIRFQRPGVVGGNAPIAGADDSLESLRCTVTQVVDESAFGRFSLESTQVPQPSVFLPIALLQDSFEYEGRANLLLVNSSRSGEELGGLLQRLMVLADYQLDLEWLEQADIWELKSDRVFIDQEIGTALMAGFPSIQPVTSYLVNEIRIGERATPYSIGAAVDPNSVAFLPDSLGPDEIVLNEWISEDLQAQPGDQVELTYYQSGRSGLLLEESSQYRVSSIVPLEGLAADRAWMPNFPGISEAEVPSDWDAGLPLDLERIREKDEDYWEQYRGAPKIFLSIQAGQAIWSTRWGNHTALRIPGGVGEGEALEQELLRLLRPEMNQILIQDFRSQAMTAASSAVDFGGLFTGMSFFLILAALGLVAMLFQFSLLLRNRESALLGSLGVGGKRQVRWRLGEALVILILGALVGLPLAMGYTKGILAFLETIWAGQSSVSTFAFHADPVTLVTGILVFLILSLLALWLAIRKQARRSLSIRLKTSGEEWAAGETRPFKTRIVVLAALAIGVASPFLSGSVMPAQGAFYLAGFALLIAGLGLCRLWLLRIASQDRIRSMDASHLGRINVAARLSRSVTVVGLIAAAVFMVLSVASFRKHVGEDWLDRPSGTGGFALLVETTAALNLPRDGATQGFEIVSGVQDDIGEVVPLRKGAGDNVNCFNLNTTSQPQLIGVDTERLQELGAFSPSLPSSEGWNALKQPLQGGAIPALVDQTTLMWALKAKVGDSFSYTNENGEEFLVQVAGVLKDSIFQGYLIVDEALLLEQFPSHPGFSLFLVDVAVSSDFESIRNRIEKAATDQGGKVELTRDILASFHEIENTYIAIFNVLGALGVVLGSLGLAIVVARSIHERLGEFSVMTAMGIPREQMTRMVFSEFSRLVIWGLGVGILASLISILPNLKTLPALPTILLVGGLLAGIVLLNLLCGYLAFQKNLPRGAMTLAQVER